MPVNVGPVSPRVVAPSSSAAPKIGSFIDLPGTTRMVVDEKGFASTMKLSIPLESLQPPIDAKVLSTVKFATVGSPLGSDSVPARFEKRNGKTYLELELKDVDPAPLRSQRMTLMLSEKAAPPRAAGGRVLGGAPVTIGFQKIDFDVTASQLAMLHADTANVRKNLTGTEDELKGMRDGSSRWFGNRALEQEVTAATGRLAIAQKQYAEVHAALLPLFTSTRPMTLAHALEQDAPERKELVRLGLALHAAPNDAALKKQFDALIDSARASKDPWVETRWLATLATSANRDGEGKTLLSAHMNVRGETDVLDQQSKELEARRTSVSDGAPVIIERLTHKLTSERSELSKLEQQLREFRSGRTVLQTVTPGYAS